MKVMQVGRYTLIVTAKRKGLTWQGHARIKPNSPAPELFSEYGTYESKSASWTENLAYASVQKEVLPALREFSERLHEADEEEPI